MGVVWGGEGRGEVSEVGTGPLVGTGPQSLCSEKGGVEEVDSTRVNSSRSIRFPLDPDEKKKTSTPESERSSTYMSVRGGVTD